MMFRHDVPDEPVLMPTTGGFFVWAPTLKASPKTKRIARMIILPLPNVPFMFVSSSL
jgi:hypothetical protein